jgi:hypothetical protein
MTDTSGQAPDTVGLYVNSDGLTFGQHTDSFFISSSVASNSPRKVTVMLNIWRLHGDNNNDDAFNILDLNHFVNFIFRQSGIPPQPQFDVGDTNCDEKVNILDLTVMVNYFFRHGPPPCGNPLK